MAVFILSSIGALDDATRGNSVKFLAATPYLDRKSSERPELDEQYYAIKALKELKSGDRVDKKIATAFLKKLYIPVNGGSDLLIHPVTRFQFLQRLDCVV